MENHVTFTIHPKELVYYSMKIVASLFIYAGLVFGIITGIASGNIPLITSIIFYIIIVIILIFVKGVMIGYIKGNAVKISQKQFSDIYSIIEKQSQALGLYKVPDVFILQQGGLLNAFATHFVGTNFIVIYSDILEEAYQENLPSVEFVIGHELGHIKRNHMTKNLWLLPSAIVPFLYHAYSRACEYTCDNIGASLSPYGVKNGLVLLAAGKKLYKKVNVEAYIEQKDTETGFWPWFAEKISSHPKLTKRVARFENLEFKPKASAFTETIELKLDEKEMGNEADNHSKYMPGG